MKRRFRFDSGYYERYYRDPRTRVASKDQVAVLGRFVCSFLRYLGQPVESVLDLGCGLGWWRPVLKKHFPEAGYLGVELSEHLCERHGWTQGSAVDFRSLRPFDLVICQGVLQYLTREEASRAIDNLAELTRGALYLEVLTRSDWKEHCDRKKTDGSVYLREGRWYRKELAPHFIACGGGLYLSSRSPATLYELERLGC